MLTSAQQQTGSQLKMAPRLECSRSRKLLLCLATLVCVDVLSYSEFVSMGLLKVQGARILMMPALHHSHVSLFATNGRALQDAGHDVTVLTSQKLKGAVVKHGLKTAINAISDEADFTIQYDQKIDIFQQESFVNKLNTLKPVFQKLCQETNANKVLMAFLGDQKFDLVVIDGVALRHCMYTVPFRLGVPYVLFTTVPDPWSSGVPALPSIEPSVLQSATNHMSLLERMKTAVNYYLFYSGALTGDVDLRSVHAGYVPTLRELHHRALMVLVNVEVTCVDYPRVAMPHYQFVGGAPATTASSREKLDPELADWMSWAPHGVIVVSLGSHPSLQRVWDVLGEKLETALEQLPKWRAVLQRDPATRSSSSQRPLPANVRLYRWLAQDAMMAHQRTRLLVTHGGSNSQLEAIYHAVPMLTLPVTGDQLYNGKRAEARGYGLTRNLHATTADDLLDAMTALITNDTYRRAIRKCSDILRAQPSAPEKVVWWVEHVLRFGGAHLRPPNLDMPLYQVFMLDALAIIALLLVLGSILLCFCARIAIRLLKRRLKTRKNKEE